MTIETFTVDGLRLGGRVVEAEQLDGTFSESHVTEDVTILQVARSPVTAVAAKVGRTVIFRERRHRIMRRIESTNRTAYDLHLEAV